ncbi:hypothetical protein SAMN03159343_2883 [Klenkia marina]|uniref:Uncharacterized protein n=1 Tax=Klenkia marina TaxID=1960309 RepID=A0A1G4YHU3_9ACTN|nr:hypothetical protein [Klenkia marina]SCX52919.1 hypothetical protein SAMN03159343_2883 [Klenkia marina]
MAVWTELSPRTPTWSPSGRRRAAVTAVVVAPAALYAGSAVLPWVSGSGSVGDVGLVEFLSPVLALLGALAGFVASSFALLSYAQRRDTVSRAAVLTYAAVAVLSLAVVVWFLTPAGAELNTVLFG